MKMRFRELRIKPVAGKDGPRETRIYKATDAASVAVLLFPRDRSPNDINEALRQVHMAGVADVVLAMPSGMEFTLCEIDDGAPARWQEDGRPSYQDLERRVGELESALHSSQVSSPAACGPRYTVTR